MYRRLLPTGSETSASDALDALALASRASATRPYVFFNFVATLDGRAALDGTTRALGGSADLEMLLALRTAADAVLIGPGTVRAEGYGRLIGSPERRARRVAAGLADDPPAVLISRGFGIPWAAGLFAAAEQPVIVYTTEHAPDAPDVAAPVEIVRLPECSPAATLADLRSRGVRALLSEGGPTLFGAFLAAGLVDELFLTLTPMLTGDAAATSILPGPRLDPPAKLAPAWVLQAGDDLFLRYTVSGETGERARA